MGHPITNMSPSLSTSWWARWLEVVEQVWPEQWRGILARQYLLAIAWQESGLRHRRQVPRGPARSLWQIEPATLDLLLSHVHVGPTLYRIAAALRVSDERDVAAMEWHDAWGASLARALLRTDPYQLVDDVQGSWEIYVRTWRPGKPNLDRWSYAWQTAAAAVRGDACM